MYPIIQCEMLNGGQTKSGYRQFILSALAFFVSCQFSPFLVALTATNFILEERTEWNKKNLYFQINYCTFVFHMQRHVFVERKIDAHETNLKALLCFPFPLDNQNLLLPCFYFIYSKNMPSRSGSRSVIDVVLVLELRFVSERCCVF